MVYQIGGPLPAGGGGPLPAEAEGRSRLGRRATPRRRPVKPAPFSYYRTRSVPETVARLAELGDGAKILAGGQSLVPMMNFRLARPGALGDGPRIPGLDYLRAGPDGLHVGALTRHRTIELCRDPAVLDGFAVLPAAARWIGHYPIRARGTLGGSIAHADPAAEWCLLAVLLGADIQLTG